MSVKIIGAQSIQHDVHVIQFDGIISMASVSEGVFVRTHVLYVSISVHLIF